MFDGERFPETSVYFIAQGETLEFIKDFERNLAIAWEKLDAIARDYGAVSVLGNVFICAARTDNPALKFLNRNAAETEFIYEANNAGEEATAAGRALAARLAAFNWIVSLNENFAALLTGNAEVDVNPHRIPVPLKYPYYQPGNRVPAAAYRRYGHEYVVSVPLTLRRVPGEGPRPPMGQYVFFTPPDCKKIKYSTVVKMQEKELGEPGDMFALERSALMAPQVPFFEPEI